MKDKDFAATIDKFFEQQETQLTEDEGFAAAIDRFFERQEKDFAAAVNKFFEQQEKDFAAAVERLIAQRQEARLTKDFATADKIRHELRAQGVTLIDQPGGKTAWHRQ